MKTETEISEVVSTAETDRIVSGNGNATANYNAPAKTNHNNRLEVGSETDSESSSVPDGGWDWVVVLGSFTMNVILYGTMYSFGVFVEDFIEYFDCSNSTVGGLGSLLLGMSWVSGNRKLHSMHDSSNRFYFHLSVKKHYLCRSKF